jgi:outer membrane protein assembly factor BamB
MTRCKVAAVIALALLGTACSRAPGETRKAGKAVATVDRPDAGHLAARTQRLVVAQSTRLSGEPGGIAVDADGSVVELDERMVVAYDTDGLERWSSPVPGAVLNWPWIGHGLVVIPTMSAADLGKNSSADDSGGCVAIDRATGERRWSYEEQSQSGVAVANVGARVYCLFSHGVVAALDVETGAVAWRAVWALELQGSERSDIAVSERTALVADVSTGTLTFTAYVRGHWFAVTSELAHGEFRQFDLDKFGPVSAPVSVRPGFIAFGVAHPGQTCEFNLRGGHARCVKVPAPSGFDTASIPAVANGTLVIAAADGSVTAIDTAKWRVKWTKTFDKSIMDSKVAIVGDVVLGTDWLRTPWALRLRDGSEITTPNVDGFVTATAVDPGGGFAVAIRGGPDGRIQRWSSPDERPKTVTASPSGVRPLPLHCGP